MKSFKQKLRLTLVLFLAPVLLAMVLLIVLISPLTKYLIERYDLKYTGRQITMDGAYVNPFTGTVNLSHLKIFELNSDSVFLSADALNLNLALSKLLSGTYEISDLELDRPRGTIIQNKTKLNFDDLVAKIASGEDSLPAKSPVHFNILNIRIKNGEFHYHEHQAPINYFIKNVNFESTGKRWDSDTFPGRLSFTAGPGSGTMQCDFTINLKTNQYRFATVIHNYDLNIIEQYLKELTNYGRFSAFLDADLKATGSFNDEEDIRASGKLVVHDFHFGKDPTDDYAAFSKMIIGITLLNPKNKNYLFDTVSLSHPYFKYELYDKTDNIETMFGKAGANIYAVQGDPSRFNLVIEIARYVKVLARNFFQSYYKINRLTIDRGGFTFHDYGLNERFSITLAPLMVLADSIDKNHRRVEMSIKSGIRPYGNGSVSLSINPKDTGDFDVQYRFEKIPVSIFNPYLLYYTSFPLDRGMLELHGTWKVREGNIQSDNHLVVIDPRVTRRIRNKELTWIPLPFVMSFIRERGNAIDYKIPISGNMKSPDFHLHDVFSDLFNNIFVKPVTASYRAEVKTTETEIEKDLTLQWQMRQNSLRPRQARFIEKMAAFLENNAAATLDVHQHPYIYKEKEYILFFEAKKMFFLFTRHSDPRAFSESDSVTVDKMSVKDSLFLHYLDRQANDSLLFTLQEKCSRLLGPSFVNARFRQLSEERANAFLFYFKEKHVENRVRLLEDENTIPFNGFSFYKIHYQGVVPNPLIKAYAKMNELNSKAPRKEFVKERDESIGRP